MCHLHCIPAQSLVTLQWWDKAQVTLKLRGSTLESLEQSRAPEQPRAAPSFHTPPQGSGQACSGGPDCRLGLPHTGRRASDQAHSLSASAPPVGCPADPQGSCEVQRPMQGANAAKKPCRVLHQAEDITAGSRRTAELSGNSKERHGLESDSEDLHSGSCTY